MQPIGDKVQPREDEMQPCENEMQPNENEMYPSEDETWTRGLDVANTNVASTVKAELCLSQRGWYKAQQG